MSSLEIDLIFGNSQLVLPHIKTGQLLPLAVTTKARTELLPNVPTVAEIGFAEAEMSVWIALFAPAGIPDGVASKLSAAALQALASPEVLSGFTAEGVFVEKDDSPGQFLAELSGQVALWKKVIDQAGIAIEIGQ
jgi:tripartite-type tricarboxylate transporter receptor subunit TctC